MKKQRHEEERIAFVLRQVEVGQVRGETGYVEGSEFHASADNPIRMGLPGSSEHENGGGFR